MYYVDVYSYIQLITNKHDTTQLVFALSFVQKRYFQLRHVLVSYILQRTLHSTHELHVLATTV